MLCVQWPIVAYGGQIPTTSCRSQQGRSQKHCWPMKKITRGTRSSNSINKLTLHHTSPQYKSKAMKIETFFKLIYSIHRCADCRHVCKVCWIWGVNPSRNKSHPQSWDEPTLTSTATGCADHNALNAPELWEIRTLRCDLFWVTLECKFYEYQIISVTSDNNWRNSW